MIRIEISDVHGLDEAQSLLGSVNEAVNTREIIDQAQAILLNRIRTRFLQKIDPDGVPWTPSHAGEARRIAGVGDTLFDTGRLWRSIQLGTITDDEAVLGTDVEYGPELQMGSVKVGPARVFMGFGEEDIMTMQAFLEHRLSEVLP